MGAAAPEAGDEAGGAARWRDLVAGGRWPRFALIAAGTWLTAAETLMTATVMPSVARDIGGFAWFGWATALFLAGSIVAGASAGQLSARLGLRRAMMIAGLAYVLGCTGCAVAPAIGWFLAGRLLQGIGGGWVVGLCFVAVTALFPQNLWTRVFSAVSGVWGAATLISPLIGGLFAEAGFWRGAFWLFTAQGAGFILAVAILVRPGAVRPEQTSDSPPIKALAVLTGAILAIAAAGVIASPLLAAALGLGGCALLAGFLALNARAKTPLLPRDAGDPRTGVGAGLAAVFGFCASSASFTVYGPALFQTLHGASPVVAGYILGMEAISWTLAALVAAGRSRPGLYIRIGSGLIVLGVMLLAATTPRAPLIASAGCALVMGSGFGLIWAFMASRVIASAPENEQALASSANPTAQMIGTAVGAAASGVIANFLGFGQGITEARAQAGGFWLFAAFAPIGLFACAAAWRLASAHIVAEPAPNR
jgi:MFS family permease